MAGAPQGALVLADEQIAGRGRHGRTWQAAPGSALLLSLVLRPTLAPEALGRIALLGAVALAETLDGLGLAPQIKWPNDVLLDGRKVAGILAEGVWQGETLGGVVLGMGLNVARAALSAAEAEQFRATTIEAALGRPAERGELLRALLARLDAWTPRAADPALLAAWRGYNVTLGRAVRVRQGDAGLGRGRRRYRRAGRAAPAHGGGPTGASVGRGRHLASGRVRVGMGVKLDWEIETEGAAYNDLGEHPRDRRQRHANRRRAALSILLIVGLIVSVVGLVLWRLWYVDHTIEQQLRDTVSAEMAALRIGDIAAYLNIQRSESNVWMLGQSDQFWAYQQLKQARDVDLTGNVLDLNIDQNRARVLVEEVIDGVHYQHVWFYWRYEDGWRHVPADVTFWGEARTDEGPGYTLTYFELDVPLASALKPSLDLVWGAGCAWLACATPLPALSVQMVPEVGRGRVLVAGQPGRAARRLAADRPGAGRRAAGPGDGPRGGPSAGRADRRAGAGRGRSPAARRRGLPGRGAGGLAGGALPGGWRHARLQLRREF